MRLSSITKKYLAEKNNIMNYIDLKKEHKLPKVLSKNEVKKILDSCENIKHKYILMVTYSAGLRRSELLNLNISDIDSERMVIHINGSKAGIKKKVTPHMLEQGTDYTFKNYWGITA